LWHGAAWTFVVWGGLHGAALAANHVWAQRGFRLPTPIAWALTLLFVMGCWVLFRSPDFTTAGDVLGSMLGLRGLGAIALKNEEIAVLLIGAVIALVGPTSQKATFSVLRPEAWVALPVGLGLAYLVLLIGGRLPNVFIYFQF
jgi:alginate O-acetyltransferase complex protein AlgI